MPKNTPLGPIPRRRQKLIEKIVLAGQRSPGKLLRAFFRGVGEEDLALYPARTLAAMAEAHFAFSLTRARGAAQVKVIRPDSAHGGDERCWLLVATEDRPFLIDSISMALAREQVAVHLLVHPVMRVQRDGRGKRLAAELAAVTDSGAPESWQLYVIDALHEPQRIDRLEREIQASITQVAMAVDDWQAMRQRALSGIATLRERCPARIARIDREEAIALLEWVESAHFVFLGYRYHHLRRARHADRLVAVRGTGLGILRDTGSSRSKRGQSQSTAHAATEMRGALRAAMREPTPLFITKADRISAVHRAEYLDQISVKDFDQQGEVCGEHRFLGLWTATAYFASPADIPVVRRKVAAVIERFGLDPRSHDGKAVLAVLETWPRDELFQSSIGELAAFARGTVNLYDRRTSRVMLRRDAPGRFWSCMVFVPRDRYTTDIRHRLEEILLYHCGGREIETQVQISASSHARVHAMIRGDETLPEQIDVAALEQSIAAAVASWTDRLQAARTAALRNGTMARLIERHGGRFPVTYQSEVSPAEALEDIAELERLALAPSESRLRLRRPTGAPLHRLHLRIAQTGSAATIAELSPLLENFGLRMLAEQAWQILATDALSAVTVQEFTLESAGHETIAIEQDSDEPGRSRFLSALRRVRAGELDNDGLNKLILRGELDADQINVLRACCRYLLQTGIPFSQSYMESTLAKHAKLAADLFELFSARLGHRGKARADDRAASAIERRIERHLEAIDSADEDRILRAFLAVVRATLRCNFLRCASSTNAVQTLAFKLDPTQIPGLPQPRPRAEIYVFGHRVEGVHLRMGEVARGGIRWSDRREDFRTEVLGLMKAQNVKNTLIVPVGAKGGFVVRRLPSSGSREALQAAGVAAYRDYINALLDVTDNIVGKRIVTPEGIHRRDGDDPYLVVAADKGTATFSDIANEIAVERGFWLGDAFASGGSAGYDHKKMGITAKGAWECVKRHFRELGHDTQSQPFTVAGIGDMSGDVFGNGMLLSRYIRLVAAFNHQHIFLDPEPNAARSFAERARLFALPRSSWSDYDRKLISRGGGVFERSAKTIALSSEVRALLDIDAATLTPQELIKAILHMRVDLLWNGGIGTYVKAHSEGHEAAGDRSNDSVRVDGRELRAKVIGEGGNLGFTQRGRVEYALGGGRINTDFIDNSAGVNTSDVEVNLKILTNRLESRGRLTRKNRNRLLSGLTDEVAELVLRNNYLQSQAISTLQWQAAARLPELQALIRSLERNGELDRALEYLPDDETLALRRKQGLALTRPELAVVLAYSKISLNRQLLATDLPEDPYFAQELARYFPPVVRTRYTGDIGKHKLRREIITTAVTNSLINRMGPTFVSRAQAETGASAAEVARAYSIAREIFEARTLWAQLEALDNRIDALTQYRAYTASARLLRHATMWLLRDRSTPLEVSTLVRELASPIRNLRSLLPSALRGSYQQHYLQSLQQHQSAGLPVKMAEALAMLQVQGITLDIAAAAKLQRTGLRETALLWFLAAERLHLDWLAQRIEQLTAEGALQAMARTGLRENARVLQSKIVAKVLKAHGKSKDPLACWENWAQREAESLRQWERTIGEVIAENSADFASLSVCVEALRALAD